MINEFDTWNIIKKKIEYSNRNDFHIRPKEVWYVNIGKNIGFESNGKDNNFKRPVLVLKIIGIMYFVASMTTKGKSDRYHFKLSNDYFNKSSFITLSQIKTIDKKRFIKKIGKIDYNDYLKIQKKLKDIIF